VIQIRSVSKKIEEELNKIEEDEIVKELARSILNYEIENYDRRSKTYTKEYEQLIDLLVKRYKNED
jgi:hypothetical protein